MNKYHKSFSETPIKSYKVHDYEDVIIKRLGSADDHSAPAIIHDSFSNNVFLATTYHGSDLYLYQYKPHKDAFSKLKKIHGKFTYPRFLDTPKESFLLLRKQYKKNEKWCGSLVMYKSSDNFSKEHLILDTYPNSIIYASRPYYYNNTVYFTYATHDYDTGNMTGWHIVGWNTKSKNIVLNIDLSKYLNQAYFYNRPTGLAIKDNKIMVAASFFNSKKDFSDEKLYIWTNTVLILEVDTNTKDKINVKVIHKNQTKAPYYNTDIFIDKNFNWIYFDDNKVFSNQKMNDQCFTNKYMMYPTIVDNSVIYCTVNNESYQLRDFNNSIRYCPKYAK